MAEQASLQQAARLVSLWSELSIRHVALGMSCGCGAGGISLRLEDFELDIVDYLEDAALRCDQPAVAAYFRARQAEGWPPSPLLLLLQDASEGDLPQAVSDWVLPRIEKTLTSFKALHGGGAGA
ncbi:hypothetical protein PSQ20_20995 [Curvibacter sp. RS43]|uniref:hypothetical protein n=1 Tax=Curvibacter microcysteis TaxID=3026419 RepID=UPI00235E74C3|nr:hypothetical protein [Curvibacter sp. RS43]MDD0812832.1 hypothetical protein [Curvibacter sp. RS43]